VTNIACFNQIVKHLFGHIALCHALSNVTGQLDITLSQTLGNSQQVRFQNDFKLTQQGDDLE
jgi:hypothetical protein